MIETLISFAFLGQVLRISVPYALAALGGSVSERSGVINIALEGKLLVGAFCAALGAYYSGSALVGAAAGVAGGVAVGALYAVTVIRFRADQIVAEAKRRTEQLKAEAEAQSRRAGDATTQKLAN